MFFDPVYFLFALPGLLLALWASAKTRMTFEKYSRTGASSCMTGAQAAARQRASARVRETKGASGGASSSEDGGVSKVALGAEPADGSLCPGDSVRCPARQATPHQKGWRASGALEAAFRPVRRGEAVCVAAKTRLFTGSCPDVLHKVARL